MYAHFLRTMKKNRKGFTLVELMVVVVIIGILVAIAVPVYSNVTDKAEESAVLANLRTINGAIASMQSSETEPSGGWSTTEITTRMPNYINGYSSIKPGTYSVVANAAAKGFIGSVALDAGVAGKTAGTYYLNGSTLSTTKP